MTPQERQQVYQSEHAALLKRLNLGMFHVIDFPHRQKVPVLSMIALKIIARQGGRATVRFTDLNK